MQQPALNGVAVEPNPKSAATRTPIVLEPNRSWLRINFRELWAHRELLYFLIWRDLKVRYKQTVLGVLWVVMQPLLMTVIFTIFLGKLVRVPTGGTPYVLLAFVGLTAWSFFSSAVVQSGNSLVANTNLVTKIYFPRLIIPAASVGARLVDFSVAAVIFGGFLVYYRIVPTWQIVMFPVCVLLMALLALGVGLWSAALNVRYRDVALILPVMVQLWMFVSPVVYPMSLVPPQWLWLYRLNPMAGLIHGMRSSLLSEPFDWVGLIIAAVETCGFLVYAIFAFRRMERHFADMI